MEGFTAEDLETWWVFPHLKGTLWEQKPPTRFPVFGAPANIYDLKEADKKLSADVDLCSRFPSTIPDDVSLATQPVSGENFEKLSDGSSHRNGETT